MKIRKLRLYHVVTRLRRPFETSFGRTLDRHAILVEVEDASGETGWGEVVADSGPWYSYETVETAWHVIRDFISKDLVGAELDSPTDFGKLRLVSSIRGHNMAKAGVECALWDLQARLAGRPLYELLGGVRDRIESGVSIGIQGSLEELVKVVGRYVEQGYKRVKIKIKPGWDVNAVRAVRGEYPDLPLQVDANAAYTLDQVQVFKLLDGYNLLMVEQPLGPDDFVDHAELAKLIRTPICLDESVKSLHDAYQAYKLGSCKIINIKPGRVGGLMACKLIHDFCAEKGLGVWIGGMLETGVGRGHLVAAATLPNVKYPNDISASDRYYEEDLVEPSWTLNSDGTISVPKRPGIGVEVVDERLRRVTARTLSIP